MANWYVRSGAGGTATGADWTNAKLTLAAAATASAAGDSIWVSEDHAESTAGAVTITFPGTVASPSFVYCVNHAGTVPPVSADLRTTATVTSTGANGITIAGSFYVYGIIFSSGSGAGSPFFSVSNTSTAWARYDACALIAGGTSGGGILIGGNPSNMRLYWNNTTVQFAAAGAGIVWRSSLWVWENTASAVVSGTLPTTLLVSNSPGTGSAIWRGVDLGALGAGKTLVPSLAAAAKVLISDCKLGASVTVAATPAAPGGTVVDLIDCDSGATNYRTERYRYEGTQTAETTIVRTGGGSDGTTTLSQKLVTTANSKWVLPFEAIPITMWNDSTSAITTLTIYGTTTGGGVPNNDDIWVEVEYLGSALTPQGSFKTSTKADNLAASAATNNSSDASTWGGGGAGNGFKIVVPSFTPGMAGPINITVKVAKVSSTYYIDPRPSISGITVSKSEILAPGVYANELSAASSGPAGKLVSVARGSPY